MDEPKQRGRRRIVERPVDHYQRPIDPAPVEKKAPAPAPIACAYATENERFVGALIGKHGLPYAYHGAQAEGHVSDFTCLAGRFVVEVGNPGRTTAEVEARAKAFTKWAWQFIYIPDYEFREKDREERILRMLRANL